MDFRQFYLGCLSQASYYVGSGDEAVVIDPQRDVEQYLDEAKAHRQQIKYVIETHSHADFVSGHKELADRTGAEIVYGKQAGTKFTTHKVADGDELVIGDVKLRFMETPGHTPESITIVAEDTSDTAAPKKMFTGDTLFIGDVGRPDLIGSIGFTSEQMAGMLYDSLHEKILPYADETEVYPAHGAGSLCGKSLSSDTWSTLGAQRQTNYALQPMSKHEFVKIVASGQPEVPMYFPKSAAKNLEGSRSLADIAPPNKLSTDEVLAFEGVVVDVRKNFEYGEGHIPNSINIGLGGQFASWAGTLIPIGTSLAIVGATKEQVDEAVMRLARVGHESVTGFILIDDFTGEQKRVEQVPVELVGSLTQTEKYLQIVDVRRSGECESGSAERSYNIPLDKLADRVGEFDPATPIYVICRGGYRSSIGCGILENAGYKTIYNVTGGTTAWIDAGLPMEK